MNTIDTIMALADALSDADFELARINSYGGDTTKAVSAAKATQDKLRAEIEALARDAERLDWMIFHSAKVRHSSDGEFCTVIWYDDEGQTRETKPFSNARDAIDAAMQEKQS